MSLERHIEKRNLKKVGRLASAALAFTLIAGCGDQASPTAQGNNENGQDSSAFALQTPETAAGEIVITPDNIDQYLTECNSLDQLLQAAKDQNKLPFPVVPEGYDTMQLTIQPQKQNGDSFIEMKSLTSGPTYLGDNILAPFDLVKLDQNTDTSKIAESYIIPTQLDQTWKGYDIVQKDSSGKTLNKIVVISSYSAYVGEFDYSSNSIPAGKLILHFEQATSKQAYLRDTLFIGIDNGNGHYSSSLDLFAKGPDGKPLYCEISDVTS